MVLFIFIWCFLGALVTPVDVSEFITRQNCFVNSQYEHRNCQSFVFERIFCAIFREHDNNECLRKRASFNPTLTPLGTRISVSRFQAGAKRTFKFHSQYLECVGLRAKENQSISASYWLERLLYYWFVSTRLCRIFGLHDHGLVYYRRRESRRR